MTLRELKVRIDALIAENDQCGNAERNELRLVMQVRRKTPTGRSKRPLYFPVEYMAGSMMTVNVAGTKVMTLIGYEEDAL